MQDRNRDFEAECQAILDAPKTTEYCRTLFGVTAEATPNDINRALGYLNDQYTPLNPVHGKIAGKVESLLTNMCNHLIAGESLERSDGEESISIGKTLDNMELDVMMAQPINDSDLNNLKKLVSKSSQYLFVVSSVRFLTPLRLAVYANDLETFKKWVQFNATALTFTAKNGYLSALHYLISELHPTTDGPNNPIKVAMMAYLQQSLRAEWWVSFCQDTLKTQESTAVLEFCIDYLQKTNVTLGENLLSTNPFLATTTWGNTLFRDSGQKDDFVLNRIHNFPELRHALTPEQKNRPETILAQHYHLKTNPCYRLRELQNFAKNSEVSPYFVSALLDTLPRCKKAIKLIDRNNPHAFTYASLNRIYQTAIALSTALVGTAFYLAYAASNMIPMITAGILLAVAIGLLGKIIHAECKKYQAKNDMSAYLIRNNYFKPDQHILDADEAFNSSPGYRS